MFNSTQNVEEPNKRFLNTFSGIEIRPMATASLSPWISVLLFLSHLRCKPFSLSLFLLNSPPEMAFGFGAFAPKDQPGKAFKRTHSTENVEEPNKRFLAVFSGMKHEGDEVCRRRDKGW